MPVLERDPWRFQFFDRTPCPDGVLIPTDDPDSWQLHPKHRWVYDKLRIAQSQSISCGPHGVMPGSFPVFSKPIVNLKGMGMGSRAVATLDELDAAYQPGHMWMELLEGEHVSSDCALVDGKIRWVRHATGVAAGRGMFECWTVHAAIMPDLSSFLSRWCEVHMRGYTGAMNFETIGGRIIEAHLRFADQWCDLYGPGWVEALVRLYETGEWAFDDATRRDGFSIPLFARHGRHYLHPSADIQAAVRAMPHVASLQITFYDDKPPEQHPMPPGGFRLGIVNATDIDAGWAALRMLASAFPADQLILAG